MTSLDPDPPTLVPGAARDHCAQCGSPLADDQRYCLNCGTRRAPRRVPLEATGALPLAPEDAATAPPPGPLTVQRLGGAWGVAALLLVALGVGVIIGNLGGDDPPAAVRPPVVTIASGATGATAAAAPVADDAPANDDWPEQDGFTVQLGELPKAGTDQAAADAAKAAATAKGAAAAGVLDAGAHGLTDGQLVVYSGVFPTRQEATAALDGLKAAYPDARVIEVSAEPSGAADTTAPDSSAGAAAGSTSSTPAPVSKSKLKASENLDPESFQKQSKKLPKTTALPGKAPEKDNAAPGAGSDAETIG